MSWMLIVLAVAGTLTRLLAGSSAGSILSVAGNVNVATNTTWTIPSPGTVPAASATAYDPSRPAAGCDAHPASRPDRSRLRVPSLRQLGVPAAWMTAALHAALSHHPPRGVRRLTGSARILLERVLTPPPATPPSRRPRPLTAH